MYTERPADSYQLPEINYKHVCFIWIRNYIDMNALFTIRSSSNFIYNTLAATIIDWRPNILWIGL